MMLSNEGFGVFHWGQLTPALLRQPRPQNPEGMEKPRKLYDEHKKGKLQCGVKF
jgi:hypothetical protein